jgi:SAM-dependent methyltransferase
MMFGTRETFRYLKCAHCGGLQIENIPEDLERHYPANYNCWTPPVTENRLNLLRRLRRKIGWRVVDYQLGCRTPMARVAHQLAQERRKVPLWMDQADLWGPTGLTRKSAILDVGCGSGANLALLARLGFSNLLGIDPFFDSAKSSGSPAVQIHKAALDDLADRSASAKSGWKGPARFKLIMFHHSLEHMPDPLRDLQAAEILLEQDGWIIIRVPLAGTVAWETYGPDWVQLDPPRHLVLFTTQSMDALARRAGLMIAKVVFDSTALQFWGSEQYRRDIPLDDARSVLHAPPNGPFTGAEMHEWEQRAVHLNESKEGDQAIFYLRRTKGVT